MLCPLCYQEYDSLYGVVDLPELVMLRVLEKLRRELHNHVCVVCVCVVLCCVVLCCVALCCCKSCLLKLQ